MTSTHYLTFQVGRQWYGVPVTTIIEVLQMVAIDELPASDAGILGLLTLRNIAMPVIDLRKCFNTDDSSLHLDTPLIALHQDGLRFAIVVDGVDDVIDTSAATWQEQHTDPYVSHSIRINNQLVLILNITQFQAMLEKV